MSAAILIPVVVEYLRSIFRHFLTVIPVINEFLVIKFALTLFLQCFFIDILKYVSFQVDLLIADKRYYCIHQVIHRFDCVALYNA